MTLQCNVNMIRNKRKFEQRKLKFSLNLYPFSGNSFPFSYNADISWRPVVLKTR